MERGIKIDSTSRCIFIEIVRVKLWKLEPGILLDKVNTAYRV